MGLTLGVRGGVRGMHEQNAHTRALEIRIVGGGAGTFIRCQGVVNQSDIQRRGGARKFVNAGYMQT